MLKTQLWPRVRGFSLIELVMVLAIMGVLLALGFPAYQQMIRNSAIRSEAESYLTGLQLAKVEALKRNLTIRFQIVDSLDAGCDELFGTNAASWIVSRNSALGTCNAAADPMIAISPVSVASFVLLKPPARASRDVVISADNALFCFNSLGMLTEINCAGAATTATNINFGTADGACRTSLSGSGYACLRVAVSAGGTARLCDPMITTADDVRRCP